MTIKRITTTVPAHRLTGLERCLRAAGVPGMVVFVNYKRNTQ